MRRLIHYGDAPIEAVRPTTMAGAKYEWHAGSKPDGLWVSADGDDDWPSWCKDEDFRDCSKQVATEIVLRQDHGLLILKTATAMTLFDREYGLDGEKPFSRRRIDWPRVASRYTGIIIAPYQWTHRLDGQLSGWYYTWDCASGCIWSPDAVRECRVIEQPALVD
jgi:hypothetical protein